MENKREFIRHCRQLYRRTLLEDVVPFWMRHGIDRQYGGIGNTIDDLGKPYGHDKFLWSQGRALWTFSALVNRIENRPEWREFADHIYRYIASHGRDDRGYWMYRLGPDGQVLDRDISLYVDGFVMTGLGEYYVATRNAAVRDLALATYENILARIRQPGSYGVAPYEIPAGLKAHGIRMIFCFFFYNLGQALGRPEICQEGLKLAHEIFGDFYSPKRNAIMEFVSIDGRPVDVPATRTCVPGHVLEALWFTTTMFEQTGEEALIQRCAELTRRHLELAWDEEYGGLRLSIDLDGQRPYYSENADCKAWWVHSEALVATAYAYVHTGADWALDWHKRIQDYAYAKYPVPTGEWTQWLDRQGRKRATAALPVKDPFHLPRTLIYLIDLFEN
jgi:N-acylglucosamine 2-epimerase